MKKTYYPQANQNLDLAKMEQEILAFWQKEQIFERSVYNRNVASYEEAEDNTSPVINSCSLNDHKNCRHSNDNSQETAKQFVFYDGPPFANGLPHYGHLLTGFIKDIFARYQTMKGNKVERRFGWDTHGLPVEMETEKELTSIHNKPIAGQLAIQEFGIDKFNEACEKSVMKYADKWEEYVTKQGRFVDFGNSYKTMDLGYMESVIWAFKELYKKGLIYNKLRVVPYSWACQTPLSNFETRMDNAYRQKESKAVTLKFYLKNITKLIADLVNKNKQNTGIFSKINFDKGDSHKGNGEKDLTEANNLDAIKSIAMLVWTTTPWTLPSNLAVAINRNISYSLIITKEQQENGATEALIIASNLIKRYQKELEGAKIVAMLSGQDLIGLQYQPIFPFLVNKPEVLSAKNCFTVIDADFVSTEDGTGIVHIAPGFGEEDQIVCEKYRIPTVCPVDEAGRFTSDIDNI